MPDELIPPDTEGAMRQYLRDHVGVTAVFAGRIFFGVPDNLTTYPVTALTRIGGGKGVAGNVDNALLQVDVWGGIHDKAGCWAATAVVIGAIVELDATPATITGKARLHSPGPSSWAWLPSPDDERSRYSLTVPVAAVAV